MGFVGAHRRSGRVVGSAPVLLDFNQGPLLIYGARWNIERRPRDRSLALYPASANALTIALHRCAIGSAFPSGARSVSIHVRHFLLVRVGVDCRRAL